MLIHHCANFYHRLDQLIWRQNVSESQRRVEDFTECAGVDDTAAIIETLQAGQRRPGKTKLGVVVVLKNVSVAFARKIDERGAARQTHGHAERELMRRCDVNYFRRGFLWWIANDEPFSIDRSRNNCRTGETEYAARLVKSGIFHPCDFTSIHQGECADHHCLLRSSGDDDLIVMTM